MNRTFEILKQLGRHALEPSVVKRAAIISVIAGTILVTINHGSRICDGTFCRDSLIQALLTMLVPYSVSTLTSFIAIGNHAPLSSKS